MAIIKKNMDLLDNVAKEMSLGIEAALLDIGSYTVKNMKKITKTGDSSGRLTDSITYQTVKSSSRKGKNAVDSDVLSKPLDPDYVFIGSAAPHAQYRETYSGTHINHEGSDVFIEEMKKWVMRELGIDANGAPEERAAFSAIIKSVRDNPRNEGIPFVEPNILVTEKYAAMAITRGIRKHIKAVT